MPTTHIHPATVLHELVSDAIVAVLGEDYAGTDPVIRGAKNPEFGDFQINAAMSLGKRVGTPPRELAQQLVDAMDVSDGCGSSVLLSLSGSLAPKPSSSSMAFFSSAASFAASISARLASFSSRSASSAPARGRITTRCPAA